MAATTLRLQHAQEQKGPAHAAKKTPDAAGKAKGVLSVNSKLFLLQTRDDNKKNSNQLNLARVEHTIYTILWNEQVKGHYITFRNAKHELL